MQDEWIRQARNLIGNDPEIEADQIFENLIASGCPNDLADKIVIFLPSAYADFVLAGLEIISLDSYEPVYGNGVVGRSRRMSEEEVYISASRMAKSEIENTGSPDETFMAVARRSAELDGVNNALEGGTTVDDLKGAMVARSVIFRGDPPEGDPKWWQFWK